MDYDVVIATRNRAEVLKFSIPLILNQNRKPKKLIIVDSSNDHHLVRRTVQSITSDSDVTLEIVHSQKACSAHQRNLGVELVDSPVVMFPDDDALWWPGYAEAVMRIYERDTDGVIGGVSGRETTKAPPGTFLAEHNVYKMKISHRFLRKINGVRHRFDDRICPDPVWVHGRSYWNMRPVPKWLHTMNAVLVEYLGGFRMSFRTELIRHHGFDEDLGIHIGWAASEDACISFHVLRERLLVAAHDAKVYHHFFPAARANGFQVGFFTQFNRAYVVCRYSLPGSAARRAIKRFALYKMMQWMLGIHNQFGRERVRGTLYALRLMKELLNAPPDQLRQRYLDICQKVMLEIRGTT